MKPKIMNYLKTNTSHFTALTLLLPLFRSVSFKD